MKEKLLFVTPHLSTGGLPQYLLKQIEEFLPIYNIYVIEIANVSNDYVVQKNKIKELVNIITLGDDKSEILTHINNISPNIIHFQEVPEFNLSDDILFKIFQRDQGYKIFVTTHGSWTNPNDIKFHPDKYILVSEWSKKQFVKTGIPLTIWEYHIPKRIPKKKQKQELLGFDPSYKHVLHVGLFTQGKNQKEIIEVARLCQDEKIIFHFVGNMAGNFYEYWKPILDDLPKNCIIHGEQENPLNYYEASDLFYFPSIYELNPLSLKEASSFGLKIITKNLHTYENYYDNKAVYSTDNPEENKKLLINLLNEDKKRNEDEVTIVLAHTNNLFRKNMLKRCLSTINTEIILSCNNPVDEETQSLCDYVLYSKDNQLLDKDEYAEHNVIFEYWKINAKGERITKTPPFEHSFGVYNLIKQGVNFADKLNKKKIHIVNYDTLIYSDTLNDNYKQLNSKDLILYYNNNIDKNDGYKTNFFSGNITPLLELFNYYKTKSIFYINFKKFEEKMYDLIKDYKFNVVEQCLTDKVTTDLEGVHNQFSSFDIYELEITDIEPNININFVDGPFVEITGGPNIRYDITFKNKKTNKIEYKSTIGRNNWTKSTLKYFIDWEITVSSQKGKHVFNTDLTNKRAYIAIDSKSLGDSIAWMPYLDEFSKKHNCTVIASTFWNNFFEKTYPNIEFIMPGQVAQNIHAKYVLGWFYNNQMEPMLPNTIPLQMAATNILGLDYTEIKPTIDFKPKKRPIKEKYITIATHSTSALKFWLHPNGWDELTEFLNNKGYTVVNISKEGNNVKNAITPNNYDINNIMNYIHHSEIFIGLGSGLSWLSWAIGKHVVMINNFTDLNHEFTTNTTRIYNHNVCNSCWTNPNFKFDKGDWNWCPIHKGTSRQHECQKSITTEDVILNLKQHTNLNI
jgi:autotransporter strand-loop-strand O-heptosyltransferase